MAQGIAARTNAPSPKFHLALQKLVMVAACPLITKKMKSYKLILKKDHAGIAAESLTQLQEICKYIKKAISNESCADFLEPKVFNVTYPLEAETKKKAAATASY